MLCVLFGRIDDKLLLKADQRMHMQIKYTTTLLRAWLYKMNQ